MSQEGFSAPSDPMRCSKRPFIYTTGAQVSSPAAETVGGGGGQLPLLLIPLILVGVIGPEWGRCCSGHANDGIMTAGLRPRSDRGAGPPG